MAQFNTYMLMYINSTVELILSIWELFDLIIECSLTIIVYTSLGLLPGLQAF